MGNFNRDNDRGGRSGGRSSGGRGFNDRSQRGPVEMHQAVCGKCGKNCEVPFRPTNDRPVYCSSCFENNRGSDSRGGEGRSFDRPSNFEDREMFSATCADCGSSCQVPFRPTNGKPVFCSNCFGEKKGAGSREDRPSQSQNKSEFAELNTKLDKILSLLSPKITTKAIKDEIQEVKEPARNASQSVADGEIKELIVEEQPVIVEKKLKAAKKKSSKKE